MRTDAPPPDFERACTAAVSDLLRGWELPADDLVQRLRLAGEPPAYDTPHQIVLASTAALAAQALAAVAFAQESGAEPQDVSIDLVQAAAGLCTVRYQHLNGYHLPQLPDQEFRGGFYETRDGRQFYPIGPYPHLRNGILELLDCSNSRPAIARAIGRHDAEALDELFARHGLPGAYVRTREEWLAHPQGALLAATPVVRIERTGSGTRPPRPRTDGLPLSGIRVLDASHVIAGPVAARTLASQGAQVLRVSAPHQPDPAEQILDTGIGKRSAHLDLRLATDRERLDALCRTADVFVQSWRPGAMARLGLAAEDLAQRHPGIVYVSASAYGQEGPWAGRGGFEQVGQVVTGLTHTESRGGAPRMVPTFLLNDYLTAYLAAAGAAVALRLRARDGGSYHVSVSLARTSMWVQELGQQPVPRDAQDAFALRPRMESRPTPFGRLDHVPPIAQFSRTPARWDFPPTPLGAQPATWPGEPA